MRSSEARRLWGTLAGATVVGALLSLGPLPQTRGDAVPCGNSSPQCDGDCDKGLVCTGFSRGGETTCECLEVGCCQFNSSTCVNDVPSIACPVNADQFVPGGTCGVDCNPPTETPTPTATVTPTRTGIPDGGSCSDPADCTSGNCVDDVCCDTPCTGPGEACNLLGRQGTCTKIAAPAPAASQSGLLLIALVLCAIGALSVWRRQMR